MRSTREMKATTWSSTSSWMSAPDGKDYHEGYGAYLADNAVRVTIENSDPIPIDNGSQVSATRSGRPSCATSSNRMGVLRETSDGEVGERG